MGASTLVLMVASVLGAEDVTLVQFSADWCEHCQNMQPTMARLRADGYPIERVNVDQQKEKIATHRVRALPTFIVMKNGREVKRVEGEVSYAQLIQLYESAGYQKSARGSSTAPIVRGQSPASSANSPPPAPRKGMLSSAFERFKGAVQGTDTRSSSKSSSTVDSSSRDRRNSPSPTSAAAGVSPQQMALRASVKLRIEDATGFSFGSGTIIDTHGDDALVLTCGHIFRESGGKGPIEVQIYTPQGIKKVSGKLLAWEPDYRDIGLIAIRPGAFVTAAKVATAPNFQPRDAVFSVGCDHGADPSIREGRITSLNRFSGSPNIEVNGKPAQGRSGGGLFNTRGELIGVCKLANPTDNEGIYAALQSVHFHLDKVGLKQVYAQGNTQQALAQTDGVADQGHIERELPGPLAPHRDVAPPSRPSPVTRSLTNVGNVREQARDIAQSLRGQTDTEVIVILRPKNDPTAKSEVLVVDSASDDLIASIRSAIGRSRAAAEAKVASAKRGAMGITQTADRRSRLVRGQSQN